MWAAITLPVSGGAAAKRGIQCLSVVRNTVFGFLASARVYGVGLASTYQSLIFVGSQGEPARGKQDPIDLPACSRAFFKSFMKWHDHLEFWGFGVWGFGVWGLGLGV